jgi:cell shape-determining protein MreC
MYHRRFRTPSKPTIFAVLMIGSVVVMFLPREWVPPAGDATQLLAVLQYPTNKATERLLEPVHSLRESDIPPEQHETTRRENETLTNENVALQEEVTRLRQTIAALAGLRDIPGFPQQCNLIPAEVVALDAAGYRDSLLVGRGQRHEVETGDWVTTKLALRSGTETGVTAGAAILAKESLIGYVGRARPYQSRIILLSDAAAAKPLRVHIPSADETADKPDWVDEGDPRREFLLKGIGRGKMLIPEIDARLVRAGLIETGDLVTSDGRDPRLPVEMVVGQIVELRERRRESEKPLYFDALVSPRVDPRDLSEVYVVDLSLEGR